MSETTLDKFSVDTTGNPNLPATASVDEVLIEIVTTQATQNPDYKLIHSAFIRKGVRAHRLAIVYEIISRNNGTFKHYVLDIYDIQKRKKGWFFGIENKFTISNENNEIESLYKFLSTFFTQNQPNQIGDYVVIEKNQLQSLSNITYHNQDDLVQEVLENPQLLDSLFEKGGEELIKYWSRITNSESHLSLLSELLSALKNSSEGEKLQTLQLIKNLNLSEKDLNVISGRKDNLDTFKKELNEDNSWSEIDWQAFFEKNYWIFGYGLSYKFLKILQREAHVANTNITGNLDPIGDFLLADNSFTVLVELKRPDTPLFENEGNRAGSWKLSTHLTYAVSQILEQKASWQIKSQSQQYVSTGLPINQKTCDPRTILIIGHSEQFSGTDMVNMVKAKTFELYRRNLKDIEICTYDELLERASFIVKD